MSRTTFSFKEGDQERLLTISSHGYFQVFDKELREAVTWYKQAVVGDDGKWTWTENPEYKKSVLYEGECGYDLDDAEMGELAAKLFSRYLEITGGGCVEKGESGDEENTCWYP